MSPTAGEVTDWPQQTSETCTESLLLIEPRIEPVTGASRSSPRHRKKSRKTPKKKPRKTPKKKLHKAERFAQTAHWNYDHSSLLMMSPTGSGHDVTELQHSGPSATTPQREYSIMTFTPKQSEELEKFFEQTNYPTVSKRMQIARKTNLTEQRVNVRYIKANQITLLVSRPPPFIILCRRAVIIHYSLCNIMAF